MTPITAALRFVNECYPARSLGAFAGKWDGGLFRGTFMLEAGFRVYRLIFDAAKTWNVTSVPIVDHSTMDYSTMGDPADWQ